MGKPKLKKEQIENVQIDYGLIIMNYGEPDQERLGPTRGGGEFNATKNIRDIEYDGQPGKTKSLQTIDEINALLKTTILDTQLSTLAKIMPHADYDEATKIIKNAQLGAIPLSKYLKNITMFAKVINGGYKKITLFNAMNETDFVLTAGPKAEGEVAVEFHAHYDPEEDEAQTIFTIEDVTEIVDSSTTSTTTEG